MNTLNDSAFLQLVLWHSADAVCGEVGVSRLQGGHQHILIGRLLKSRLSIYWQEDDQYLDIFLVRKPHLDAAKTTKVFVTLLLPFRNQVGIRDLLLNGVFNCVNLKIMRCSKKNSMQTSWNNKVIKYIMMTWTCGASD